MICYIFFLEYTYYPERGDKDIVIRFTKEANNYQIKEAIFQGKEILELKKFPSEFVQKTANKYPFNKSHESTAEDYYE